MIPNQIRTSIFVSVIIPTYDDWNRLKKCLTALSNQTYPKEKFEVIIVNNHPTDNIPEFIKCYRYKIYREKKRGSYSARNKGLSKAKGDVIAFTDSDCIPDFLWLEKAVSRFNEGCQRLAGNINIFPRSKRPKIAELYDMTFGFDQEIASKTGLSVTANMFALSSLFKKYGTFNDSLFSGGDTEWSRRLVRQDINIVYAPEVIVCHPARENLKDLFKKRRRVSAKKSIGKNTISNISVKALPDRYWKRFHFLFFKKKYYVKGIAVVVLAILLKLYSKFIKILFKLNFLSSSN